MKSDVIINRNRSEGDQIDSFQNATMDFHGSYAFSIAVYPDVPNDLQSLDEICDYLADLLQPVAEKAKRVEIQIGDSEL
jgi:hypothetical protein